jgi:hypothetical protein
MGQNRHMGIVKVIWSHPKFDTRYLLITEKYDMSDLSDYL